MMLSPQKPFTGKRHTTHRELLRRLVISAGLSAADADWFTTALLEQAAQAGYKLSLRQTVFTTCHDCNGLGYRIQLLTGRVPCHRCHGKGKR